MLAISHGPDGSVVFKLENIDVPERWSQLAVDILAQKYFRKAGIPQLGPDGKALVGPDGKDIPLKLEGETSNGSTTRVLSVTKPEQRFDFTDVRLPAQIQGRIDALQGAEAG